MLIQTQIYKMLRTTDTFAAKMSVMRNTACSLCNGRMDKSEFICKFVTGVQIFIIWQKRHFRILEKPRL